MSEGRKEGRNLKPKYLQVILVKFPPTKTLGNHSSFCAQFPFPSHHCHFSSDISTSSSHFYYCNISKKSFLCWKQCLLITLLSLHLSFASSSFHPYLDHIWPALYRNYDRSVCMYHIWHSITLRRETPCFPALPHASLHHICTSIALWKATIPSLVATTISNLSLSLPHICTSISRLVRI